MLWLLAKVEPLWSRRLTLGLFANLATHPLVWMYFPLLPLAYGPRIVASELWAFGAEAWFYAVLAFPKAKGRGVLLSFAANATSFGLGWLVVSRFGRYLF